MPHSADDGAYDAERTEAEKPSDPQLAADVHLDVPEQHDGDQDEENVAQDIQHDCGVENGGLSFEPGVHAHGENSLSEGWADDEFCTCTYHCTRDREHENTPPVHVQPPRVSQELSEEEDKTKLHTKYRGIREHHRSSLILDIIIQDVDDIGRRGYETCANIDLDLVVGKDKVDHDGGSDESYARKTQEVVIDEEIRELDKADDEAKKTDQYSNDGAKYGDNLATEHQNRYSEPQHSGSNAPKTIRPYREGLIVELLSD